MGLTDAKLLPPTDLSNHRLLRRVLDSHCLASRLKASVIPVLHTPFSKTLGEGQFTPVLHTPLSKASIIPVLHTPLAKATITPMVHLFLRPVSPQCSIHLFLREPLQLVTFIIGYTTPVSPGDNRGPLRRRRQNTLCMKQMCIIYIVCGHCPTKINRGRKSTKIGVQA